MYYSAAMSHVGVLWSLYLIEWQRNEDGFNGAPCCLGGQDYAADRHLAQFDMTCQLLHVPPSTFHYLAHDTKTKSLPQSVGVNTCICATD